MDFNGEAMACDYFIEFEASRLRLTQPSSSHNDQLSTRNTSPFWRVIREAIEFHLDGLRQDGEDIPSPTAHVEYVDVPQAA